MTAADVPPATAQSLYSLQPGFTPEAMRSAFKSVTNVRTLVIYCPDPRASRIPEAIASEFSENWPGDIIRDAEGNKIAFSANVGQLITAGGRAVDAVRSVTLLNHLLGVRRVVVVHHTFCGMTAFTRDSVIHAYRHEHGHDLSHVHDREDMVIEDFDRSLRHDVALLRAAPGVPKSVQLFGYLYDINTEKLHKIVEDPGAA